MAADQPVIALPLADAQMLLAWMDETFGNDSGTDWLDEDAAAVGDALNAAIENFKRMRAACGVKECFPLIDPNVPEFGSRYPDKGCYRVGCVVHGGPPCTVCGKQASEHGTYPTCATHPYSPDGRCGHVGTFADGRFTGVPCAGAECKNGCVAVRGAEGDGDGR